METKQVQFSQISKNKHIYVEHEGNHVTGPPYTHDCIMVGYIAHGSGYHEIDNKQLPVSEGDIFMVNPFVKHRFLPSAGLRRIDTYSCYFLPDIIKNQWKTFEEEYKDLTLFFSGINSFIKSVDTAQQEIRDIFITMIDEYMNHPPCYTNILLGCLLILLTKIFRNVVTKDFKRVYSSNNVVDDMIRYIHKHIYSRISLNDLSARMNLSPSYICRLFKKHVGMSTSEFINLLRVEKIKDMLKNTNKPIECIPEMFHFTPEYVKHIFKQGTGMSMADYKKKYHYKSIID